MTCKGSFIERTFTKAGVHPFDEIEWKRVDVVITDYKTGEVVFEQRNIEVPATWSETATNIVASKYFHGAGETRESSVRQLITRVVNTIVEAGELACWR